MTLVVGSVVQLRASRDDGVASHSGNSAKAEIALKVAGGQVLWVASRLPPRWTGATPADIRVTDRGSIPPPGSGAAARDRVPRADPVGLGDVRGRPVLGNVPPALMAEIAAMQLRKGVSSRRLAWRT